MGQPGGARRPALAIALVVAGAGLSLARQPGAGALDTVYAEDGSVFLASALSQSTLESISTPYAGYLHTAPRLLTELVSLAPLSWAASLLALAAAVVTGLLVLLVFVASRDHLSTAGRLLAAAVVVLVPVGQEELPNSIANLHWPALYALFWVLVWRPASHALQAVAVTAVLLITLSDLLAVVFIPLAAWVWWRRRSWHAAALPVGLAFQALAVLFGQSDRELNPEPVMWAPWWVIRAVPTGLLGQRWFGSDVSARWLALAGFAWLLLLAAVIAAVAATRRRAALSLAPPSSAALSSATPSFGTPSFGTPSSGTPSSALAAEGAGPRAAPSASPAAPSASPAAAAGFSATRAGQAVRALAVWRAAPGEPDWRFAALAAAHCLALYALPVFLSGQATPRYAAAPAMLLVTALAALLLPRPAPLSEPAAWRAFPARGVALIALCAIVWAVNLRVPNERAHGPIWSDELGRAESSCAVGAEAQIALAPAGWSMSVPCNEVAAWE